MKIKIGDRLIGEDEPCFIIAEVGVNHNGSMDLAKKLVDAAVDVGADAVKFQTFKTEKLVTKTAEQADYQKGSGRSQYEMLKQLELSYDNFMELKGYCDKKGIMFLSTPHSSEEDVDVLDDLVPAFKISSADLTNIPLLEYVATKGKPVILSTGMGDMDEVKEAVNIIKMYNEKLIVLHCTTNYPASIDEINLKAMKTMEKELNPLVGYSDHTVGIDASLAAVALGACVIERHFTLDKDLPGPDHKASLNPEEMKEMINKIRELEGLKNKEDVLNNIAETDKILGDGIKKSTKSENEIKRVARKSIVAAVDIKKGSTITSDMLAVKRPGTGIEPKRLREMIGKRARCDIKEDELISWDAVE